MKRILITGAAGYLGQGIGRHLQRTGYSIIGIDDYSTSSRDLESPFKIIEQDLTRSEETFRKLESFQPFDAVMHFAARALVAESFLKTHEYFHNNLGATLTVAELCRKYKIRHIVHSSSCSVYGTPKCSPISEEEALSPISPYGASKKGSEAILENYSGTFNIHVLALRYFNPAGAFTKDRWGEAHEPETHILPRIVEAATTGGIFQVKGERHPTPDGTCIRDFIHVEDLALAHQKALEFLLQGKGQVFSALNVGTGRGTSVLELIKAVESVLSVKVSVEKIEAHIGDPPILQANVQKFKDVFGWLPEIGIEQMVQDHFAFIKSRKTTR